MIFKLDFIDRYVYEIMYRFVFEQYMKEEGMPLVAISLDKTFLWFDGVIE